MAIATKEEPKTTQKQQKQQKQIDKDLEAAFKAACKEARELLVAADRSDVLARYKIGLIIYSVMDESKYGEGGVERMEAELGLKQKVLYKYGKVAATWTEPEFKAEMKRTNAKGLPLTWSHYEQLARVQDGRKLNGFITRALKEFLSVDALKAIIDADKQEAKQAVAGEVTEVSPSVAIRPLDQALDAFEKVTRNWEEQALPGLITSREKMKKKDVAKLTETLKRVNDTKTALGKLSDEIEKVLAPPQEQVPSRVVEAGSGVQAVAGA